LAATFAAAVQNQVRVGIPAEESLQAQQIRRAGASEQYGSDAALVEPDPSQDEGSHDELPQLSRTHDESAQPNGIERNRNTSLGTGHGSRERRSARQLMQLAGELPAFERLKLNLLIETVAPGYLSRTIQQKPGWDGALADLEDGLSRCEPALLRFGETSYDTELRLPKPWEPLSAPITGWHHLFDLLWRPHVLTPVAQPTGQMVHHEGPR
jgi:hypothetical protein